MGAVAYLNNQGLCVELERDRLKVYPASRITPECRRWILEHKPEIMAELRATPDSNYNLVNDSGEQLSRAWNVTARGVTFTMIARFPCTKSYMESRVRPRWPEAEVTPPNTHTKEAYTA